MPERWRVAFVVCPAEYPASDMQKRLNASVNAPFGAECPVRILPHVTQPSEMTQGPFGTANANGGADR